MKKIFMILASVISLSAFAHPSDRTHYFGERGEIIYSNTIQPVVIEKTYRQGQNIITETTTKSCVRIRENRNHLTCSQWRSDTRKSVDRNQRRHDRDYREGPRHGYDNWNRG